MSGQVEDPGLAPVPATTRDQPRPTARDHEKWAEFASGAPSRLANAVRVWRNGYVLLITGLGALAVATASLLVEQDAPLGWRIVLTALLGASMLCAGVALWLAMSSEVRMKTDSIDLAKVVHDHLSFEQYLIDEASVGMLRLSSSHAWAAVAAALGLATLLCLLWVGA